jgi:hypothetical protein
MDRVDEFFVYLTVAIALLVAVGSAAYVIFRRIYTRSAERMAHHIGQTLTEISDAALSSPLAGAGAAAARVASGRLSNFGAYAASQGLSEEAARAEFARSIERVAKAMDYAIKIPVIGGVGLDALLGLVPVAGDAASAAISLSLIARSVRYGIPREIITRMLANVLVDLLLGAVPVIGDLADLWFKANQRNVALLKEYLGDEARNVIDVVAKRE